ncbi:ATP-binding protein [Chryseobacterium cucumeris]|uniref:ATP-binding protein n=1 Tax=Chryseobacterium cucumeris TaxID=1813611 RepID=UPI001F4B5871|nr:ATP-binding protein [Chryseobacterium cucumeris]
MKQIEKVSIALQPSVYNTFRALNNTVALTLSEYVDNAVQSYLDNKDVILSIYPDFIFEVNIEVDQKSNQIIIRDNAAGIDFVNYQRAFEPANIPLDNTKLNEFGMGMKTASIWLADKWSVRTKALGEEVERFTEFDLHKVIKENKEELIVVETSKEPKLHYTEIVLSNLSHNAPSPYQMDKVRRHLSSIYRVFLRTDEVTIVVNGEKLVAPNYEILDVPFYNASNSNNILWKKEIDFSLGKYKAKGFIAILKTIQNNANGLVLLRRGRVIVGGDEDRFFPNSIFGSPGNFRYKRLFGEIELSGFDVTFNKNGFTDEENLSAFIDALREELRDPNFNLLSQADNYRVKTKEENSKIAEKIIKTQQKEVDKEPLTDKIKKVEDASSNRENIAIEDEKISNADTLGSVEDYFDYDDISYKFQVDLINEDESDALYAVKQEDVKIEGKIISCLICKINLAHPFFNRFEQFRKAGDYQPIIEIFKSFAIAEFHATKKKMQYPSELRTFFNSYIVQ